jgi:hypothetical protein
LPEENVPEAGLAVLNVEQRGCSGIRILHKGFVWTEFFPASKGGIPDAKSPLHAI